MPEIQLSTEYNAVVSYEEIMPKIYFWHKTLTTTHQNSKTIITHQSVDYTAGISALENILETPPENAISPFLNRKTGFLWLLPKNTLQEYVTGNMHFEDVYESTKKLNETEIAKIIPKTNWQKEYEIVIMCSDSNDILDTNHIPYPKTIHRNYIDGQISDKYYDLQKLHAYLQKKPKRFVLKGNKIQTIPWYNQDEDQTQTIEFYFIPTREEYIPIYNAESQYDRDKIIAKTMGIEQFAL